MWSTLLYNLPPRSIHICNLVSENDRPIYRYGFPQLSAPAPPRKTRAELMKDIDADYYGYRDEDDGILVPLEQEEEKLGREF